MKIRFIQNAPLVLCVLLFGCDLLNEDRCLDRGGSWDSGKKLCSVAAEDLGQGLDLLTVLVANDAKLFDGKRVSVSGIATTPGLLCSRHDKTECLHIYAIELEVGAQVVVSGVLQLSGEGGQRGELSATEILDVRREQK